MEVIALKCSKSPTCAFKIQLMYNVGICHPVLGDNLEGWDGGGGEEDSRGRGRMCTYGWLMLYGRNQLSSN